MQTEKEVIETLKVFLKQDKKTYKDVATWLNLSEGSVKRLFSQSEMSLERLLLILEKLGRNFTDLAMDMAAQNRQITQISEEQERELVDDLPTLLVAQAVLSHLSCEEMAEQHGFSEALVERSLLVLNRLRIIELLPNNRYRLNVSSQFRWLAGGPIQQFFMEKLAAEFMETQLQPNEDVMLIGAMLGEASRQRLDDLMEDFAKEMALLNMRDRALPLVEKQAALVVLAKRYDWKSEFVKSQLARGS